MRWYQLRDPPDGGDHPVAMGMRLNAVEAQLDAMRNEFCAMRDAIVDLQERLANPLPPVVTTATPNLEGAQTGGEASHLFGPSDGTPWGDLLEVEQVQYESTTLEAQGAADDSLSAGPQVSEVDVERAAQQLQEILQQVQLCEADLLSGRGSADAHMQIVKDRATAALQALGYEVVHPAAEGGAMEVEEIQSGGDAELTAGQLADTRDAPDAQSGGGGDREQNGRRAATADADQPAAARNDMEVTAAEVESEGTWTSEQGPGAYVLPLTHGPIMPPDRSVDDELETIIAMAQQIHARDTASEGWPISLPGSWYMQDPKRAGRCIARAALARDPTPQDLSFKTQAVRTRSGGEIRLLHRSVVHFAMWNNTFHGDLQPTVAAAERAAPRLALDAYSQWIDWQQDDARCLQHWALL